MPPEAAGAPDPVAVEVPASCANLGPGFDALAVAVDLPLTVTVAAPRDDRRVAVAGEGAGELPEDDGNRVWQAFLAYCDWAGVAAPEISLAADSAIPLERGLGSSAAAAVAGVVLARAVTGGGGADADLVRLAAAFDGHADNVAAALHGGLVVVADGRARVLTPTEGLRPVLCVPEQRQATDAARGVLPEAVPLAEAAATAARAALVTAGLCGAAALDAEAMADVLHEPPRFAAMPATGALVRALREAGLPACLSGAGPTALAVADAGDAGAADRVARLAGAGWRVQPRRWHRAGASLGSWLAAGAER